jgi:hypothetical protein
MYEKVAPQAAEKRSASQVSVNMMVLGGASHVGETLRMRWCKASITSWSRAHCYRNVLWQYVYLPMKEHGFPRCR